MTSEYHVRVHQEDGTWWAEVVDLPGCFAVGADLNELRASLVEAVSLYDDVPRKASPIEPPDGLRFVADSPRWHRDGPTPAPHPDGPDDPTADAALGQTSARRNR